MLLRLLLWAVVIAVVWSLVKPRRTPRATGTSAKALPMLRCAHCDVHVPMDEATVVDGVPFCCEAHARLGVKKGSS